MAYFLPPTATKESCHHPEKTRKQVILPFQKKWPQQINVERV
jgi:hypothetical protein